MGTSVDKVRETEQEAQYEDPKQEALHLKSLAETEYRSANLKSALKYAKRAHNLYPKLDGISEMVTSFKILRTATKSPGEHYKILQVEPFSHMNVIKKQYKKLALTLHPDKNPYLGSEEAFKLVCESFQFLSDRLRRKEYDMKLRIRMQEEVVGADSIRNLAEVDTFWTKCLRCGLLHKFEKKYMRHDLLCPHCRKSFRAVEVEINETAGEEHLVGEKASKSSNLGLSKMADDLNLKQKMDNDNQAGGCELEENVNSDKNREVSGDWGGGRLRRRIGSVLEVLEMARSGKKSKAGEDLMTLAEMKLKMKRKSSQESTPVKSISKEKEKKKVTKVQNEDINEEEDGEDEEEEDERLMTFKKSKILETEKQRPLKKRSLNREGHHSSKQTTELPVFRRRDSKSRDMEFQVYRRRDSKRRDMELEVNRSTKSKSRDMELPVKRSTESISRDMELQVNRSTELKSRDMEVMVVEDSDFYDFDKDRVERSFKKGQVWAIYDHDDGLPRNYGLIDEVVSVHPFGVKMSWLDFQNNGDERLICLEKMGCRMSCGRFKVGRSTAVDLVKIFSHAVDCERAAREIYRIYPKKGSIWAIYREATSDRERRNLQPRGTHCYDIVVVLTTYSELHGLSMAYLEKVDGFKAVFKRQAIGFHAIRWLEKFDFKLFSHQIPARKLSGNDIPDELKGCWELDPASLPSDLLTVKETRSGYELPH